MSFTADCGHETNCGSRHVSGRDDRGILITQCCSCWVGSKPGSGFKRSAKSGSVGRVGRHGGRL